MGFGSAYTDASIGENAAFNARQNADASMRAAATDQDRLDELRRNRAADQQARSVIDASPMSPLPTFDTSGTMPGYTPAPVASPTPTGQQNWPGQGRPGVGAPVASTNWGPDNQSLAESSRLARQPVPNQQATADRANLTRVPAALYDVVQAPAAGAMNIASNLVTGAGNLAGRVGNAIVGSDKFRTDMTGPQWSLTPAYDKVRAMDATQTTAAQRLEQLRALSPTQGSAPAPATTQPAAGSAPPPSAPLVDRIKYWESRGNPNAVSPKGAKGEMQVMDATNRDPGYGVAPARDNSPEERARVGRDYLNALLQRYGGNEAAAAAAYNMGPGAFEQWVNAGADPAKMPAETRTYVANVTGGNAQAPQTVAPSVPSPTTGVPQASAPVLDPNAPVPHGAGYTASGGMDMGRATLDQMANQHDMLLKLAAVTRDPLKKLDLRNQADQLRGQFAETQLYQSYGQGNLPAMVNAVNSMLGKRMTVADAGNGNVVFLDDQGKQLSGAIPQRQAATQLYEMASPLMRQINMSLAQKRAEADIKTQGEVTVENVKGQNQRQNTLVQGQNILQQEATKAAIDAGMNMNSYNLTTNSVTGDVYMMPKMGRGPSYIYVPAQKTGPYTSEGHWQPVAGLTPGG